MVSLPARRRPRPGRRRSPPSLGGSRSGTSTRRPAAPSTRGRALEQQPVLEHAAGEHDGRDARARRRRARTPQPWPRPQPRGSAPTPSTPACPAQSRRRPLARWRAASSTPVGPHRHRVGPRSTAIGDGLQLDRRLALVVDPRADAAQRRDGVEQPAHARGLGSRQAGAGQLGDRAPARRRHLTAERRRQRRLLLPGRHEPGAGHPPRLAHGRVAAGHADREQVADALEGGQVADEQLAAPHRAVGAVAGAVVDRAHGRPGLAVLGQARGQVRVVVLHAHELDARRARARTSSTGTRGAGRGRRRPGSTANSRSKCATPSAKERSVSQFRRSPMWWPTQARVALRDAERALELGAAGEHAGAAPSPAASRLAGT